MFSVMQIFFEVACGKFFAKGRRIVLLRLPDDDVAEAWVGQDLSGLMRADESFGRRTNKPNLMTGTVAE